MCCGATRNDDEVQQGKTPVQGATRKFNDSARWLSDNSASPFLSSADDGRVEDTRMEIHILRAKRLRSGFASVNFVQPICRVTLSDGRTDGMLLGQTPVSVRHQQEDTDTWNYHATVALNRIDLLRSTTTVCFEILDVANNDMYCIREFSGLDLHNLIMKAGTVKKALKLPGGGGIPKRNGKAPSIHVGVQVIPNPYQMSTSPLSGLSKSPSARYKKGEEVSQENSTKLSELTELSEPPSPERTAQKLPLVEEFQPPLLVSKQVEATVSESMKAPQSPQHSVHSKTHRQITRTLSSHVLPRQVDQSLRSYSGNDRKGKVQMTFLLSACKKAVAPDAVKMFYVEGKLSASFSRCYRYATQYFNACLTAVQVGESKRESMSFKDVDSYENFLISIRACQLLLFKNDKENSTVQARVVEELRRDLVNVVEVLRIYIVLITRLTQIAVWEGKCGLVGSLLRRSWLDLISMRLALEDYHDNTKKEFVLINALETFLEDVTLKCGESVGRQEKMHVEVFMTDSHVDKHEPREIGSVLAIDHDGPRNELFAHCQEIIFELPAKTAWGFRLGFHGANHIMCIEKIKPDSVSEKSGLKIGDYIDEIGGDLLTQGGIEQAMVFIEKHKLAEEYFVEVVVYRELHEDVHAATMDKELAKHNKRQTDIQSPKSLQASKRKSSNVSF